VTAVSYDDLVAAAAVGLSHSPLRLSALAGPAAGHEAVLAKDDQAAALLDAAALMTAARRAGVLPQAGVTAPPPAAADTAAELPAGAARLLRRPGSPGLVADLLTEAASRGYRAPAPLLPFLLDLAARDWSLRPAVAAVLGSRGRWLARCRADWQQVADAAALNAAPAGAGRADSGDPAVWETGGRADRRAYLAVLRDRDPAAARDLLADSWSRETGDDRESLLAVLATGLAEADEEFLEQALDDRKQSVRAMARRLLSQLPDSGFSQRVAARAAPLLRLERHGMRRLLMATAPPGLADPAAIRDGIITRPPAPAIATGPWLLTQVIAAAPLAGWVTAFGMNPGQIVSMPVAGGVRVDVQAGWRLAAISQASAGWAQALLASSEPGQVSTRPPEAWPRDRELAAVLPAAARVARAAAVVAEPAPDSEAIAEVTGCPGPWPEPLADAVIEALSRVVAAAAREKSPAHGALRYSSFVDLVAAAGRCVPVAGADGPAGRTDYAAALGQLSNAGNCPPFWSSALRSAADTAAVRRAFLEEIR
jgi:hypothetical protein